MNNLYETVHSTNTLLGIQNQLYRDIGSVNIDKLKTLNSPNAFDVLPDLLPSSPPPIIYFGFGDNGWDADNASPRIPSATNLNLFNHRPIIIKTKTDVDGSIEMYNNTYRLRTEFIFDGTEYYAFYLKKIDFSDRDVTLSQVNNTTGSTTNYIHVADNFTPSIPTTISTVEHIVASIEGNCIIEGSELIATNTILADMKLADPDSVDIIDTINEIGFYSGEDYDNGVEGGGHRIEAIGVQLAMHRCIQPFSVSSAALKYAIPINFVNGARAVL